MTYNVAEISETLINLDFHNVVEVCNFGHNQARFAVDCRAKPSVCPV